MSIGEQEEEKMINISYIMPTLNSMRTLRECLTSIASQQYNKDSFEVLIADGGSKDGTREYCADFLQKEGIQFHILENPLMTAEAGKAVGVRTAKYPVIALVDSDNILPDEQWLIRMTEPFDNPLVVASEPLSFTFRKEDILINRYFSLLGMGDPLCLFLGNYDRFCQVTGKWTQIPFEARDEGKYMTIRFPDMIPTIGANGFLIRRDILLHNFEGDYLFDIDIMWQLMHKYPDMLFAKVKTSIVHLFCKNVSMFYRKQKRRISDFLYFSKANGRSYPWGKTQRSSIVLFVLACVLIIPLLVQSVIGFIRKPNNAWAFHPLACWITLWVYGTQTIIGLFKVKTINRDNWTQ